MRWIALALVCCALIGAATVVYLDRQKAERAEALRKAEAKEQGTVYYPPR